MKAATGETTLTIITVIAIGGVLLFFTGWWRRKQVQIDTNFNDGVKLTIMNNRF